MILMLRSGHQHLELSLRVDMVALARGSDATMRDYDYITREGANAQGSCTFRHQNSLRIEQRPN